MKTILHQQMLVLLTFMFAFTSGSLLAQNPFCEDFNANPITPVSGPGCTGTAVNGVLNNWGTINANVGYNDANSIGGPGDVYLDIDDQGCGNGGSFIYNPVDYAGNWLALTQDEGCFCFDIRTFYIQTGTLTPNTLRISDGNDPLSSTTTATFVMNGSYDVSRGWVRICAPIEPSDGTNLPSNADGQWVINSGGAAAWDALILNVQSISFYVDVGAGDEKFGIDNICLSQDCDSTYNEDPEPTNEGAYCCDESDNLVANGNFEFGDTGFNSQYTSNAANLPSQYNVTNDASIFGATVTDHSFCEDPVAYPNNDQYLLVNGLTNQPAGSSSIIWSQTLTGLDSEKEYRFCANFKNMPQCTFDVLPEITLTTNTGVNQTFTISTDPTDPCDWQNIDFCFSGNQQVRINIELSEDSLGDGNDLAIDDISVQELIDPNLSISVLHQGNPQQVTGSINTISPSDDQLPYDPAICQEPWYWFVFTVDTFSGGTITIDFSSSYGWGNDTLGSSLFNPAGVGPNWDLTTQFPGFPFAQNELYLVGMYTPNCCADCVDEGFTYQLILNNLGPQPVGLDPQDKQQILAILGTYQGTIGATFPTNENGSGPTSLVNLYPNPAKSTVTISMVQDTFNQVKLTNVNGAILSHLDLSQNTNQETIDISALASGVYFVSIVTDSQQTITKKLVVE